MKVVPEILDSLKDSAFLFPMECDKKPTHELIRL